MNIRIDKSFEKDTDKINDRNILSKLSQIIDEIKNYQRPAELKNLKKLKGSRHHYRIRMGDYRIGITIIANTVTFIRFLHRKEIYRYFP